MPLAKKELYGSYEYTCRAVGCNIWWTALYGDCLSHDSLSGLAAGPCQRGPPQHRRHQVVERHQGVAVTRGRKGSLVDHWSVVGCCGWQWNRVKTSTPSSQPVGGRRLPAQRVVPKRKRSSPPPRSAGQQGDLRVASGHPFPLCCCECTHWSSTHKRVSLAGPLGPPACQAATDWAVLSLHRSLPVGS